MKHFAFMALLTSQSLLAHAQWSTYHGNNQRNGLTTLVAPTNPRILWSHNVGGPVLSSPVIAPDGSIIVGASWQETKHPTLNIVAVRPDGTLKWKHTLPWIEDATMSTPVVGSDGRVYAGTPSGTLICLDSNGNEVWRYQTPSPIQSHILLTQGQYLYLQHQGKLMSWTTDGQKRWEYDLGYDIPGGPTETLDGNILAIGIGVHCVNPAGQQVWHTTVSGTAAPVAVSPNGDVIVGGSTVTALNPTSGAVKWSASITAYGTYGSPAIDGQGNIYYGFDYNLYKIGPSGNVLAQRYIDDPNSFYLGHTVGSPLIDGAGRLFWGLGNGKRSAVAFEKRVVVLNSSLQQVAKVDLPEIPFTSNPAISSGGQVYIGCLDGKLYALGL
ncbi:MAG: PQQ-binding-like beta-propeller repeat protein [Chthonomonadaceae bacterium]|nr:PQQ-binding-like beta-propeller repeat protein [Chthonomonadaceae bacterium]